MRIHPSCSSSVIATACLFGGAGLIGAINAPDFAPRRDEVSTDIRGTKPVSDSSPKTLSEILLGSRRDEAFRQRLLEGHVDADVGSEVQCNTILDIISLAELSSTMQGVVNELADPGTLENIFLTQLLVSNLKTGVAVAHVCGSCLESIPESQTSDHADYCDESIYGADHLHSGLVLIPTLSDGEDEPRLAPGTHKGYVFLRGTESTVAGDPNLVWTGREDPNTGVGIWLYVAMASAQSSVFIAPHYMGYGKSEDLFKSYIIRKGYETSIIPLWCATKELVRKESNGCAALGDAAKVAGYSEGGYVAAVVAHALEANAGVEIVQLETGGAPFKVSSEALVYIFELINAGTFEPGYNVFLGYLGVAYSSTYASVSNFDSDQDMLSAEVREDFVSTFSGPTTLSVDDLSEFVEASIPSNATNILGIFPAYFTDAIQGYLSEGNRDPCNTAPILELQSLGVDQLCAAYIESDLTTTLASFDFPVQFCHSTEDDIISIDNLPSTMKPNFSLVPGVTGNHFEAAVTCLFQQIQNAINGAQDFIDLEIPALHAEDVGQCSGKTLPPTTVEPTDAPPTASPTETSGAPLKYIHSASFWLATTVIMSAFLGPMAI